MMEWQKNEALEYYRIPKWGEGYFGINDQGELSVYTDRANDNISISIPKVIEEMEKQNIKLPAVIRFQDILRQQVQKINEIFRRVINEAGYQSNYKAVFPIKVNQMREVVEEILVAGEEYQHGLEAGSKTELLAVLAYNNNKDSLTILNGYKDEEYMRLALMGQLIGRNIIVVIEKFTELSMLLKVAAEMNVVPKIGIRAKLATVCGGKWVSSSGDSAKFGLSVAEILNAVDLLKEEGMLASLKLLHFHIGSQLQDIRDIKDAITEGARIYTDLIKKGVDLEYFDAGGGLGVDYDGSQSSNEASINYDMEVYASDLVYILKQICDLENVRHPTIVTESGRALVASHSIVVTTVFDKIEKVNNDFSTSFEQGEHILVTNMRELSFDLNQENFQDISNDAQQFKEEAMNAFKLGVLNLEERAKIETLYWEIFSRIKVMLENFPIIENSSDIDNVKELLANKYLCNFSVFQSLPDTWAIGQLLPIVPLSRLNERPTEDCTLADITCDSDGRIDQFIGNQSNRNTLLLHSFDHREEYHLGIFLTGAYQDVMGDNHNLFGRLNEVHVYKDENDQNNFYIEEIIKGTTSRKVLQTMQYNDQSMVFAIKKLLDEKIKNGQIPPKTGIGLINFYEKCLRGYTYLK